MGETIFLLVVTLVLLFFTVAIARSIAKDIRNERSYWRWRKQMEDPDFRRAYNELSKGR